MSNVKVYLQKPWKFSEDSQYYDLLYKHPPRGIEYIPSKKTKLLQKGKNVFIFDLMKRVIRRLVKNFYPGMPNAHYDEEADKYDLIHCMRCISINKRPWICDIEFAGGFWITTEPQQGISRKRILNYLQSPYCKKIIPWTEWCANNIRNIFPEIKDKIEVVYPAVPSRKFKKVETGKTVLLYASRRFYFKGGLYALEVMDKITKNNRAVEGWIVSDVPNEVYEKYKSNSQIRFMGTLPQKELFENIYPRADIFLYPSFTDTFGYVILEAMSFGVPIVSLDGLSRKELVINNITGKLVSVNNNGHFNPDILERLDKNIVSSLLIETNNLILNKKLIKKMSKNCIRETSVGRFSINERNKKLGKIIMEALK